ncbi:hypothetical protein M422DRAFT_219126 [Sphaerobolus stellatus SS14]|nr:hypothetical protein M422DRAFT_219126 [Sphaerobolus stellatus SS14]
MGADDDETTNYLWDIPFHTLHQILAGDLEGHKLEDIATYVKLRINNLGSCVDPYGPSSAASRKKVESGTITLDGGATVSVPKESRDAVWAISRMLHLDEVDAFILWKTFLRNRGLPSTIDTPTDEDILAHFIPFYFEERLSLLRCMMALLQAKDDLDNDIHSVAKENIDKIISKPRDFASSIGKQYLRRSKQPLPEAIMKDPRNASRYAKQSVREQAIMLELLFWTLSECGLHDGSLTEEIYKIAYESNLGADQQNGSLLLDEEGVQIVRDMETLWTLVLVELLQIDQLLVKDNAETTKDSTLLVAFPEYITKTQDLIFTNATSRHGCVLLAWACLLAHLSDMDPAENSAYEAIIATAGERFRQISTHILQPEFRLFQNMQSTLTSSSLFVTSAAISSGSPITYPNSGAYRFVYKTLLMGLSQLVQTEFIPDFDGLIDVWVALFGTGEESVAARICRNYWDYDYKVLPARRGIFDVARSRFPVQVAPLLRLLRATAGTGSLDTNPIATDEANRKICGYYVYHYFLRLPTFTQVISVSARTGPSAIYEPLIDADLYTGGVMYRNLHSVRFPGGTVLPRGSSSRLLSTVTDPNDPVVVEWERQHSGWRILLEILRDYVKRIDRHRSNDNHQTADNTLTLQEVGVEHLEGDQLVTDALDLIRTVVHGNEEIMTELMNELETIPPGHRAGPDLVEVTTRILEDELSRSARRRDATSSRLITSAVGVLTALLSLPKYAYRVWPFLRSSSLVFGSDSQSGTPSLLASERATGKYDMTTSLIGLVRALFDQAISSLITSDPVMQPLKEVVLLRAVKFVHRELWVEHSAWKYAKLGDRFEIGRQISSLYGDILRNCPPSSSKEDGAFAGIVQFIMDAFLFRASTASISPLVYAISTGDELLDSLTRARSSSDSSRTLVFLLEGHVRLTRLLLDRKFASPFSTKLSLLEQALCVGIVGGAISLDSRRSKHDPVDVLTTYVQYRLPKSTLPVQSVKLLSSLCRSLASADITPPSIVAHLSDAESIAAAFIRIIRNPWDDLRLRNALWHFVTLTVDVQPALASLFVRGQFHIPDDKGKEKEKDEKDAKNADVFNDSSAVKAASESLGHWEALWEANPQLLTSVLRFLEVVWRHVREHKATLEPTRTDKAFWEALASIGGRELGPAPEFNTKEVVDYEGHTHSDCYPGVLSYAYRTRAKAHAIQIMALDIEFALANRKSSDKALVKPISFQIAERYFTSKEELNDHISEAIANYYDSGCHKRLAHDIQHAFPTLANLQTQENTEEREYGDDYIFPTVLIRTRILYSDEDDAEDLRHKIYTVNLNMSLADSEVALTRSWKRLLQVACPLLRGSAAIREYALSVAETVSGDIASETRSGAPMVTIHAERLAVLLGLMEIAWFIPPAPAAAKKETQLFVSLLTHIQNLVTSEFFPPAAALRSDRTTRFHRVIVQLIYFCAHKARLLGSKPKAFTAEQRLSIASTLTASVRFVIEALRDTFDLARSSRDLELDKDLELLVPTFEQCTRTELPLDPAIWLSRCQEYDIIRSSLELLVRTDITGLQDPALLRSRRQPLYARHILFFHLSLARLSSSAERLANDGVVAAYANSNLRPLLSTGMVEPSISEFPGERSPAHRAWCTMLAVVIGVAGAMGPNSHFVHEEVLGFIHLFGSQITHSLTWRAGDPLTLPFLEEMSNVVALFSTIASSNGAHDGRVRATLQTYAIKASELLQDLNYALTHPNHLASLLDPITPEERSQIEKDARNISVESPSQLADASKRPLLAALLQKLLFVARDLLSSLVIISQADSVLTGDSTEWPTEDVLVPPITKIAPGEPASTGTLLELGTCAVDILKHVSATVASSAEKPAVLSSSIPLPSFSARSTAIAASQVLETVLTYAVTQLALWVEIAEHHQEGGRGMDLDEGHEREGGEKRRRTSMGVGGRVRKEEMVEDLKSLLSTSRPVIEKAQQQLKLDSQGIVLLLIGFLEKRLALEN